jgi:manganese/zinc/iron transport system substrate-binding protein
LKSLFSATSVWLGVLSVLIAGCDSSAPSSAPDGKYRIVTTCGMVTDIVRQIVGERATVTGLMGEGVDPHLYLPTRDDIAKLDEADVVVYSGLTLEGRMVENFETLKASGKLVFAMTDAIDKAQLRQPPEMEGHYDPHVWMDVSLWSACVEHIAEELATAHPAHKDEYLKNASAYRKQLEELDGYVKKSIASIPESQRVLVTAHDAFGYFSRRYEIPVRSPQWISTESEASTKDINDLVDFLVERKVPALFVETSTNSKSLKAIIEGAAQKGVTVRIGGELFSDAMGAPGTYEGTYIGMLDHNATVITRALGGEAPERGFQGKLRDQGSGIGDQGK